jgi:O-antigen ligase
MNIGLKQNLRDIFIINLFILDVLISTTTTYKTSFLLFKLLFTSVLMIIIFYNKPLLFSLKNLLPPNITIYFSLLIVLCLFSLTYSLNPYFGFQKILNLSVSTIPLVFIFNYLWLTSNKTTIKIFLYSILLAGVISVLFILIISPFSFNSVYSFSMTRWSHQIYGRFIGLVFIILFFIIPEVKETKKKLFLISAEIIIGYGTYSAGSRGILSGVILICIVYMLIRFIKKDINILELTINSLVMLSVAGIIFLFPSTPQIINRYENSTSISDLKFHGDKQIKERFEAYKISLEQIKENPLRGIGFGGFKTFYKTDLPIWMEYPHNIFLESQLELGIPGLLLILFLLYRIFSDTSKISGQLTLLIFFGFWLSLFSKDLASQSLLYLGLVFTIPAAREIPFVKNRKQLQECL